MRYVVVKQGNYIKGFTTSFYYESAAKSMANALAREDHDDYHSYDVYEVDPNKVVLFTAGLDNKPLYSVRHSEA